MKTYSQQELEKMVNGDLNKTAGILAGKVKKACTYQYYKLWTPDYCGNWGAVGALIESCDIDLRWNPLGDLSNEAVSPNLERSTHRNIKRAITIVYILIKQGA